MEPKVMLLCKDDDISGRIYTQFCALNAQNFLKEQQKNSFLETLINLMNKLSSVKYHQNNFIEIEKKAYKEAQERLKNKNYEIETEFALQTEFEAFLFQVKSSLDILVKLLNSTADSKIIATSTFGDKGNKVIKGLKKFKSKKGTKVETIDRLIQLILDEQPVWMEATVGMRDFISHYSSLNGYCFNTRKFPNGEVKLEKPLIAGKYAEDLMNIIVKNLCEFSQDFMVLCIDLVLPPIFKLVKHRLPQVI